MIFMTRIVIIGAGPAGRFASMAAAEVGNEVTLIENKHIGGKYIKNKIYKQLNLPENVYYFDI